MQDPKKINFPSDFKGKIVDIKYGKHHVLALTSLGKAFTECIMCIQIVLQASAFSNDLWLQYTQHSG